jgi:hypothetical protein
VSIIRFMIPLAAAHALVDEAVFARGAAAGFDAPDFEFQDSNSGAETQIRCSAPMARFILKEVRRLGARSPYDVELSFAFTEAAVIVQRAINAHDALSDG